MLCTEATLNAVQRRYLQIYKSSERLLLAPESIGVGLRDFMISVKSRLPHCLRLAHCLSFHLMPLHSPNKCEGCSSTRHTPTMPLRTPNEREGCSSTCHTPNMPLHSPNECEGCLLTPCTPPHPSVIQMSVRGVCM